MMERKYQQSWRDIQVKLERRLEERLKKDKMNVCPDCSNKLYFLEGGFLCPVCGFSTEIVYSN
jgi:predicted amidophosphoribosyltransferase